jgi:hypothetical protein
MAKLRLPIEMLAWNAEPVPGTALRKLLTCVPEWVARSQWSTRCWDEKKLHVAVRSILRKSQKILKRALKIQTVKDAVRFGDLPLSATVKIPVQV